MKSMRKVIPALVLLLVSAVILSTASYAWFSMNTSVTATGMEVKAKVSTQLMIKGSATNAEYKSAINFVDATDSANSGSNFKTELPATAYKGRIEDATSTLIKTSAEWKKIIAKNDIVKDDGTITNGDHGSTWDSAVADMFGDATAGTDYIKDDFTLKLVGEYKSTANMTYELTAITRNLEGKLAAEGEDKVQVSPIYQAIHVAIVATYDGSTYLKEIDLGTASLVYDASGSFATLTVTDNAFDNFTVANQEHSYSVYIWYDGEDENCTNANASAIDQFEFEFKFDYVNA